MIQAKDMKIVMAPVRVTPDVKGKCLSRIRCETSSKNGAMAITHIAALALPMIRSFAVVLWLLLKCLASKSGATATALFVPRAVPPFDPAPPPMLGFPAILVLIVRPVMYLDLTAGRRRIGVPACRIPRLEASLFHAPQWSIRSFLV